MQEVVKDELRNAPSIRRKYGYILDFEKISEGKFSKRREYIKINNQNYQNIPKDNLYVLPDGMYTVFILHIQNEVADFSPFIKWLQEQEETVDDIKLLLRQVVLLVPLAWIFHFLRLDSVWYTFMVTEIIVTNVRLILY